MPYDPPSCPAGSEQIDPAQVIGWVTREQAEAALGDYAFLLNWVPDWLAGAPFLLGDLCAAPPSGPFDLTEEELEEIVQDPLAFLGTIRDLVNNRIRWHVWNTYCQCSASGGDPQPLCFSNEVIATGVYGLWPLNEASGTDALDISAPAANLQYGTRATLGASPIVPGSTRAVTATGANGDAYANKFCNWTYAGLYEDTQPHSFGVWVRTTQTGGPVAFMTNYSPGNNSYFILGMNGGQAFWQSLASNSGSAVSQLTATGPAINDGQPHFVVAVRTGSSGSGAGATPGTVTLYVDGVDRGSMTLVGNGVISIGATTVELGRIKASSNYQWVYNGDMAYAMLFDGIGLSGAQVADFYDKAINGCGTPAGPIETLPAAEVPPSVELPPSPPTCSTEQLCADVNAMMRTIAGLSETVRVIQSQAAPFSYRTGETFTGLTGTGNVAVRATIGARVDITTLPASYGTILANPPVLVDIGWVALATADGWLPAQRIQHDNLLLLPPVPGIITGIYYSLRPGVVASITTLERIR
jgi:hypothetical protein